MKKQEIITDLSIKISSCIENEANMDSASWGYEEGVLITPNMAIEIVKLLNKTNP